MHNEILGHVPTMRFNISGLQTFEPNSVAVLQMDTMLEKALEPSTHEAATNVAIQALYIAVNIASGTEKHKNRIMDTNIP